MVSIYMQDLVQCQYIIFIKAVSYFIFVLHFLDVYKDIFVSDIFVYMVVKYALYCFPWFCNALFVSVKFVTVICLFLFS